MHMDRGVKLSNIEYSVTWSDTEVDVDSKKELLSYSIKILK